MDYLLLTLGVALFAGAHWFKRLMPERRAAMGAAGKGAVAVALAVAIASMALGYRGAPVVPLWIPPPFTVHVANVLVLVAFWFFALSVIPGTMSARIRHKQLTAVKTWAVAHLLANGDLASVVLFGGLLAWAVGSAVLIGRAEPTWDKPPNASVRNDALAFGAGALAYGAVAIVHTWLGVYPLPS